MSPLIVTILTVFIIGLVSFIIGYALTDSSWERKYYKLNQEHQNLVNQKEKHVKKDKSNGVVKNDYNVLRKEIDSLQEENKELRANLKSDGKSKSQNKEVSRVTKMYEWENKKRLELEKENKRLLSELSMSSNVVGSLKGKKTVH